MLRADLEDRLAQDLGWASERVTAAVDRLALAKQRKVTRPLAAEALASLGETRE
jgi:hypothetical protein